MRVTLSGGIALAVATVVLLGALTAGSAVGPASASYSLDTLCDVCVHDAFDEAGGERSATVTFSRDGTVEWRAEVAITDESLADEWRDRPPEIDTRYGGSPEVTDDDRLVVTYGRSSASGRPDPGAVRPAAAGALMTELLHRPDGVWLVNVHRFRVVGPDGYVVTGAPGDPVVAGSNATWTFDDERIGRGGGPELAGGRVVFVPADASAPTIRSAVAIGVAIVGPGVLGVHPLYWGALYAGMGTTIAVAHFGRPPSERLRRVPLAVVVLATAAIPFLLIVTSGGGSGDLPGPVETVVAVAVTAIVGLFFGVFGLIGYAVAAGTPDTGRW